MAYQIEGGQWYSAAETASLLGITRGALQVRRHRDRKAGRSHPRCIRIGTETIYEARSVANFIAQGL